MTRDYNELRSDCVIENREAVRVIIHGKRRHSRYR